MNSTKLIMVDDKGLEIGSVSTNTYPSNWLLIHALSVDIDHRRKGLATTLVNSICKDSELNLFTYANEYSQSIFEAKGFEIKLLHPYNFTDANDGLDYNYMEKIL